MSSEQNHSANTKPDNLPPYPTEENIIVPPPEHRDDKHERDDPKRRGLLIKVGASALVVVVGVGGYLGLRGGGDTENAPRAETTTSAPATPGQTEAPKANLTPEQAVGIKQTGYEKVNTVDDPNMAEYIERASQPIPADTPLSEAVKQFGEKSNIYLLSGDEKILDSMYGTENRNDDSEHAAMVYRETRHHGLVNDRFSYFEGESKAQIVNVNTGKPVDVTLHDAYVPIKQLSDSTIEVEHRYNTNFENVDRSEVFSNNKGLDSSYTDTVEITFKTEDGNLVVASGESLG